MARTAADVLIETLIDWGVDTVFGIPGDGINGIMESLRTHQDRIRFVQVRHEESAAFAACGYAKFTGRLGVCLATSGPGGLHLTNGLYDAKLDGASVLAITGHHYSDLIETDQQQDVDLTRVFEDVAVYNALVMNAAHVENVAPLAIRTALARHGVAHLCFPTDIQEDEVDDADRSKDNVPGHASDVFAASGGVPDERSVRRAAEVLNGGSKTVILAGRGALDAGDLLERVADTLAAPIVKPLLGKGVVPDDSPYTTGGIGLLGTKPSEDALNDCDTILIVGSSFPYIDFYPRPGQARGVQIDHDPTRIGLRFPVDAGLVGDARRSLELLLPMLRRRDDRSFLEKAQAGMKDWWALLDERASRLDVPMKPQRLATELGKRLADDAIVVSDSGTITTWFARFIRARRGQQFSLSGNLATMACGLPYAIGAQIAYPDRQVVALVGDGGFSMLMADFVTAVKYGLPIKVVIVKNDVLGQIKWEQMVFLGNPEYGVELAPIDFVKVAEACGGSGLTIDDPRTCGADLEAALAMPGPVVVQAVVDPLEAPMPPRITTEQALHFAESLLRGEPDRVEIAKNALGRKIRELV
ncbi:MAG TPA: thiamine pyrophosphate-dependent enzyme [Candidatus Limnocylindrales bacterium]|nr:thiamine pyrophosphate-dependent enzyme [Candidatus Limnocylindrales bacterium]